MRFISLKSKRAPPPPPPHETPPPPPPPEQARRLMPGEKQAYKRLSLRLPLAPGHYDTVDCPLRCGFGRVAAFHIPSANAFVVQKLLIRAPFLIANRYSELAAS